MYKNGLVKTYVCPAYMITGRPVGIHEDGIFVDLIFKVNSKSIFDDGEAKKNSAVLSSKSSKRFKVKDLASFSKLRFFGNGVGVLFPKVYKPFHVSGSCMEKKTSSESKISGEWGVFFFHSEGSALLFCYTSNFRAVIPFRVFHGVHKYLTGFVCIRSILVVTNFICDK
jgi:hypothetical protein